MGFKDECGVSGIYGAPNAASLSYFALVSLQHRGQESAGIAVSDGSCIKMKKAMGLVGDIFTQSDFEKLKGNIAVGHVRYATAGGRTIDKAQPFLNTFKLGSIALAHNGQLVNHTEIREKLEDLGYTFSSSSDSEVILKLIVRKFIENGGKLGSGEHNQKRFIDAVIQTVKEIKGSFALCIMTEDMLIGVRDPNGIRPLCMGKLPHPALSLSCRFGFDFANAKAGDFKGQSPLGEGGVGATECDAGGRLSPSYILASESCAIDAVNGEFVRDIASGEMVVINKDGISSYKTGENEHKKTCIFEYVYFARPDSVIDRIPVQEARYRMGQALALESPVEADCVVGVPDSGIGAAMGYAKASGIP